MSNQENKLAQYLMAEKDVMPMVIVDNTVIYQAECRSDCDRLRGRVTLNLNIGGYVISKDMTFETRLTTRLQRKQIRFYGGPSLYDDDDDIVGAKCLVMTNGYHGISYYELHDPDGKPVTDLSDAQLHKILEARWPEWQDQVCLEIVPVSNRHL